MYKKIVSKVISLILTLSMAQATFTCEPDQLAPQTTDHITLRLHFGINKTIIATDNNFAPSDKDSHNQDSYNHDLDNQDLNNLELDFKKLDITEHDIQQQDTKEQKSKKDAWGIGN